MIFPKPPETVIVAGQEYPIETDFRASISFEQLQGDPELSREGLALGLLDLYFPQYAGRFQAVTHEDDPELVHLALHSAEAAQEILNFYQGGMPVGNSKGRKGRRVFDFAFDEAYIYASFLEAYNIDLRAVKLHWWNFKALFSAIPPDSIIGRIMQIRAVEITSKMSADEKARYRKLKRLYALPEKLSEKEQEEDEKLMAVLEGSGDLAELR